jgi:uncharacterized phosphosugar-binding protein
MTAAERYAEAVRGVLDHLVGRQRDAIEQAATLVEASVLNGGVVFCAAIGHGNEQDFLNRAGGPAFLQPFSYALTVRDPVPDCRANQPGGRAGGDVEIEATRTAVRCSRMRAGDVLAVGSVSGRNKRPVELALACREIGVKVIGFTSLDYTRRVESAHPSGLKLADVSDVVIDLGVPFGDAAIAIEGYEIALLPLSGVSAVTAGWMIWGRALERMAARGCPASVFMSLNRPDGRDWYEQARARYHRLGY